MTRRGLKLVSLLLCCLTGCAGHTVDLDRTAPASSAPTSSDPSVFAEEGLAGVWVDEQRLYWLTYFGTFQSCLKADCEHTRVTYAKGSHEQAVPVAVANGHVYWALDLARVFSCPAEGCGGEPVKVVRDPGLRAHIYANQDHVYWSSDVDIYRCAASGCGPTPEVVVSGAIAGQLAFDETHAYWVSTGGITGGIMRARADGSQPPEPVVDWEQPDGLRSIAVGGGYLYWVSGAHVFRCPTANCNASATTLLVTTDGAIYDVTALMVDASAMYWQKASTGYTCPLEGCEQPAALTPSRVPSTPLGVNDAASFAVDATDVYWLDEGDRQPGLPPLAKAIRKTPL